MDSGVVVIHMAGTGVAQCCQLGAAQLLGTQCFAKSRRLDGALRHNSNVWNQGSWIILAKERRGCRLIKSRSKDGREGFGSGGGGAIRRGGQAGLLSLPECAARSAKE